MPTDQIVQLIIMLEHRKKNPYETSKLLTELGQVITPEILADPAIGKRLQQAVKQIEPERIT